MSHLEPAGEPQLSGHEELSRPIREGLPASYRMRADAHYVDLLTSRPAPERERVATPPPPNTERPSAVVAVPGIEAELEKSLSSLSACTDLLSQTESGLSRDVAQTLLRAELWRSTCLLKAAQVLKQHTPPIRTTIKLSKVVDQVVTGFAAERMLRSFDLQVARPLPPMAPMDDDTIVVSNERLLVVALASAVRAMLDLCGMSGSLKLSAANAADSQLILTVSQHSTALPESLTARAFSPEWTDRPGGPAGLVTMLALRQSAVLLGGHASIGPQDRGFAVVITVPAGF